MNTLALLRSARRCAPAFATLLSTSLTVAAQAQTVSANPPPTLPGQVVTATRQPSRVDELVADVTVLDRAALDRAGEKSLAEILELEAGLQLSNNGGLGRSSTLFIRGLEARHALVLVDGVPVGSATVGTPSIDNLPLESIERIEIVRGPLSALYGSAAVGGVVQLFTRQATRPLEPNLKLSVGSHGYHQVAGGVGFKGDRIDGVASLQRTSTGGFSATNAQVPFGSFNPDRDGFSQTGGSLRLGWQADRDWRIEGLVLESRGRVQLDDGPDADALAKLRTGIQSLQLRGRVDPRWQTRLAFSRSVDVYDTLRSASPFGELGAIQTDQRQLTWENGIATPIGTLLALLERIDQTVSRPGEAFTISDRTIDAVGIGLDGARDAHAWQASLRHDRNSQFGGQTTGAIGYSLAVTPRWRLGASYGTTFVAPSFNQLYFPAFGNPDLQPEEGRHTELYARWSDRRQTVRAAWFDNRIRGYISSGPQPTNIPRSRIDGFSIAWDARLDALALGASYDRIDPRNDTANSPNVGKLLPRRSKDALKLKADRRFGALSAGASLRLFSERFDDVGNTRRLGGYGLVDLRTEWIVTPEWRAGVLANNVTDKRHATAYGYEQAGRELFLTLRWAPR